MIPTGEHNLFSDFLEGGVTTFQLDQFGVQLQGYAGADISAAQGSKAGAGANGQVWSQDGRVSG